MKTAQKSTDINAAAIVILKSLNYEAQYGMMVMLVSAPYERRLARAMDAVIASDLAKALIADLSRRRHAWGWNSDSANRRADMVRRAIQARLAKQSKPRRKR